MNNRRILTIGCAVAVSLAPHGAWAASVQDGLDACASAVVGELAGDNGSPPEYRISDDSGGSRSRLRVRETIHLDVLDPGRNEIVARADCVVDSRARVKRLVSLPLSEPDAAERAVSL